MSRDEGMPPLELGALALALVGLSLIFAAALHHEPAPKPCPTPPMLIGDCDGNGQIDEIESHLCWAIEAGAVPLSACPPCDWSGNGAVETWEAENTTWLARHR